MLLHLLNEDGRGVRKNTPAPCQYSCWSCSKSHRRDNTENRLLCVFQSTLIVSKQTDDGWEFVDKTTGTSSSTALSLKVSFTAESGAYYKAECSVTVTRNGVAESETKTAYETCP